MAFKENMRLEQIYFSNLKSLITVMKTWRGEEEQGKIYDIIENCIQADAAILLLYRNLGEEWNELTAMLQKEIQDLEDLKQKIEEYHDELNEKIDEVNNYLLGLIRDLEMRVTALEARMDAVEEDLRTLVRNYILDLAFNGTEWELSYNGVNVTFEQAAEWAEHPHILWVRGELNDELTMLVPREYDTQEESGIFEWASVGFVNSTIHEVNVTLLPDDSVQVVTVIFDYGSLIDRVVALEEDMTLVKNDVDDLKDRMTNAETDIDVLEQTAENHNTRITSLESIIPEIYRIDCAYDSYYARYNSTDANGNSVSAGDILNAVNSGKFVYMRIGTVINGEFEASGYASLSSITQNVAVFRESVILEQNPVTLNWSIGGGSYTVTTNGATTRESGFVVIPTSGGGGGASAVSNFPITGTETHLSLGPIQSVNDEVTVSATYTPTAQDADKYFCANAYIMSNPSLLNILQSMNSDGGVMCKVLIKVINTTAGTSILFSDENSLVNYMGIRYPDNEEIASLNERFYITADDITNNNIMFEFTAIFENSNNYTLQDEADENAILDSIVFSIIE